MRIWYEIRLSVVTSPLGSWISIETRAKCMHHHTIGIRASGMKLPSTTNQKSKSGKHPAHLFPLHLLLPLHHREPTRAIRSLRTHTCRPSPRTERLRYRSRSSDPVDSEMEEARPTDQLERDVGAIDGRLDVPPDLEFYVMVERWMCPSPLTSTSASPISWSLPIVW